MLADHPAAPPAIRIVADALRFCADADPAEVARRAVVAGWTPTSPPRGLSVAARAPEGDEQLAAGEAVQPAASGMVQPAERLETCSVYSKAPVAGVDAQVARVLGSTPLFRYAGSSTYRAWWQRGAWRSPPTDPATFAQAKAAGAIYSLIVTEHATGSGVVVVNPRPSSIAP